jgi:hypothetical protein
LAEPPAALEAAKPDVKTRDFPALEAFSPVLADLSSPPARIVW